MEKKTDCGCERPADHHINNGISCDAKNCVYHDQECYCTAQQIKVGPRDATCSSETACVTFKERK